MLKQAEELAEGYRAKLADLEARIQALVSEMPLQGRFRKPNPIFARHELRRLALDMLREAGHPLAIRDTAIGALRAKGVRFPDRRTMKQTRVRLREIFGKMRERGHAVTVGTGKGTKRALV